MQMHDIELIGSDVKVSAPIGLLFHTGEDILVNILEEVPDILRFTVRNSILLLNVPLCLRDLSDEVKMRWSPEKYFKWNLVKG